jgi:hypothetical protein
MDTFAVRFPLTVGVNVTVMVHVAPDAMLDPQVLVCAKSPGFIPTIAMLDTATATLPLLVTAIL